jgi:hypothetical protein
MRSLNKWIAVTAGLTLVLALALVAALDWYRNFKGNVRGKECVNNLQALTGPLWSYAKQHEGHYPNRISALYPEYVDDLQVLICPEIREKYKRERGVSRSFSPAATPEQIDSLSSYAVVPNRSASDDRETVIAYEKNDNHPRVKRIRAVLAGYATWDSAEN